MFESSHVAEHSPDAPEVEPVLRQSARLVEAESVETAADVDGARTDAVDASVTQAPLGKHYPHCHGGRERRRDDDRDEVEGLDYAAGHVSALAYLMANHANRVLSLSIN